MRHSLPWIVVIACVPACGAPAPASRIDEPSAASAPARPSASPAPDALASDEALPSVLAGLASPVCQIVTEATLWPTTLRRRPGGPPVLDVDARLAATVSVPRGTPRDGAFTELGGPGGVVRGWQDAADVNLHPASSLVFGDLVIPQPHTHLTWKRADVRDGSAVLLLAFELDAHVKTSVVIEREASCSDVRLTPGDFQAEASLGAVRYWGDLAPATIPVSRVPGGSVIAELAITPDLPAHVSVHDGKGAFVQIVYYSYGQLVFGWVSQSLVKRLPKNPGVGFGSGGGFGRGGRYGGHWIDHICDHPLPLVLQSDGEPLVTVGELAAGVVFKTYLHAPGEALPRFSTIQIGDRWVQAVDENALQIPSRLLTGCRTP